jgi:hypothetical protein
MEKITYIGDGVYASFNGMHITLRVNDHRSEPVVFLEVEVMEALIQYFERLKNENNH